MTDATFFWDFFGPSADQTAAHFKRHLDQFLERNACSGCETGLSSAGAGHQAVFCRTPESFRDGIAAALRPRRIESAHGASLSVRQPPAVRS